jgi:hypothetical protein
MPTPGQGLPSSPDLSLPPWWPKGVDKSSRVLVLQQQSGTGPFSVLLVAGPRQTQHTPAFAVDSFFFPIFPTTADRTHLVPSSVLPVCPAAHPPKPASSLPHLAWA